MIGEYMSFISKRPSQVEAIRVEQRIRDLLGCKSIHSGIQFKNALMTKSH